VPSGRVFGIINDFSFIIDGRVTLVILVAVAAIYDQRIAWRKHRNQGLFRSPAAKRPDVVAARRKYIHEPGEMDSGRLVFLDKSGVI
jgi:hypothetical protein